MYVGMHLVIPMPMPLSWHDYVVAISFLAVVMFIVLTV